MTLSQTTSKPTGSALVLLMLLMSAAVACTPTASQTEGMTGFARIKFLQSELDGHAGKLMLPGASLESFRTKLAEDEAFTCFSVNIHEASDRIWVPLRRDSDVAVYLPGGEAVVPKGIALQLAQALPPGVRRVRLSLGEGRSVEATVTTGDELDIAPLAAESRLSGLAAEELLKWLVVSDPLAWTSVTESR